MQSIALHPDQRPAMGGALVCFLVIRGPRKSKTRGPLLLSMDRRDMTDLHDKETPVILQF
jgi:hypothetical protein